MQNAMIQKAIKYWVVNNIIKEEDSDIYIFGLDIIISSIISITAVMVTAILMGRVLESLALLSIIIPMQCLSGGYHAKTHLRCFFTMYIGYWCVTPLIPFISFYIGLGIVAISLIIVFLFAPVRHENVPMSEKHYKKMKEITRCITIIGAIIGVGLSGVSGNAGVYGSSMIAGMGVVAISIGAVKMINWWGDKGE